MTKNRSLVTSTFLFGFLGKIFRESTCFLSTIPLCRLLHDRFYFYLLFHFMQVHSRTNNSDGSGKKPDYGSAIEKWALQLFFHFLTHLMTNSHAKGSAKKNLVQLTCLKSIFQLISGTRSFTNILPRFYILYACSRYVDSHSILPLCWIWRLALMNSWFSKLSTTSITSLPNIKIIS